MITKELISNRWTAIIGGLATLVAALYFDYAYTLTKNALAGPNTSQMPLATRSSLMHSLANFETYSWMQWFHGDARLILALVATFLGGSLISNEVNKGTIFFVLSKAVSRERILLIKYAVSATILLMVTLLGSVGTLVAAAIQNHPLPIVPVLLSTMLLWVGTLAVLGVALFFSTLLNDLFLPALLTICFVVLISIPAFLPDWKDWSLLSYWASLPAYQGTGFPLKEALVCISSALIPLGAALLLFRHKAY